MKVNCLKEKISYFRFIPKKSFNHYSLSRIVTKTKEGLFAVESFRRSVLWSILIAKKIGRYAVSLVFFTIISGSVSIAATLTVTSTADSGAGSLRQAIADATSGDTIDFSLTYPATITLSSQLAISKDLTINGPGESNLTLSGNNSVRIFAVTAGFTVSVSDLTISLGKAPDGQLASSWSVSATSGGDGGAIHNSGTLALANVTMSDNNAGTGGSVINIWCVNAAHGGNGGAIYNAVGASLSLTTVTFDSNDAGQGGNNYLNCNATPYYAGNGGSGGAIFSAGALAISQSSFFGNRAGSGGNGAGSGSSYNPRGGNGGSGGAIHLTGTEPVVISDTFFDTNLAGWGGYGTKNTSDNGKGGDGGNGGGIYSNISSTLTITRSSFTTLLAGWGGNGGRGGQGGHGGALFNNGSTVIIEESLFDGCLAGSGQFSGIAYYGNGGSGGNIYNAGSLTITNTTLNEGLAGNGANGSGTWGGLGTGAGHGGHGGNLYNASGTASLSYVTITKGKAGNNGTGSFGVAGTPGSGGGVRVTGGTVTLNSSLVAENILYSGAASDISGTLDSASSYNLVRINTGLGGISNGVNSNQVGTSASPIDPMIGLLADNGGPTETRAILLGSPALDQVPNGTNGCGTTFTMDQRLFSRLYGAGCDIGAYEAVPAATTTTLISSVNPSSFSQNVTFTATVTSNSGTPAGTVGFFDGATSLGTATLSSGSASLSLSTLAVGTHPITAVYAGNFYHATSTSPPVSQVVVKANQATLTLNAGSPLAYNATETLSTTGGSGTGAVTYQVTAGSCTVVGNQLTADSSSGTCSITATKAADANYNETTASASVTLQKANQATLILDAGSPLTYNTTETLSTTGGTGTGAVTYQVTAGSCTVFGDQLTANSGTGTCSITATKAADTNYNQTTASASVTLQKANQATLTLNAGSPLTYNTTETLSISGGSGTGAVTYQVTAGSCTVVGDQLTAGSGIGACLIAASKAADNNYNQSNTVSATISLQKATQATLTLNAGSPLSFNATETLSTTGGSGTGEVTYQLTTGSCTMTDNQLTADSSSGTCSITATKAADANYNETTASASVTLQKANQATLILNAGTPLTYNTTETLSTTGGTGTGTVTYQVTAGTCTVVGDQLTANSGTGTCSITATKAADTNYNQITAAASVTLHKATQAALILNAGSPLTYNTTETLSTTGGTGTGTVTYQVTAGSCTVVGDQLTATSGTGTCSITATKAADANYNENTCFGFIVLGKATAEISLSSLAHTYNGSQKMATASTNPSSLTVVLTYDGSSVAPTNPGVYIVLAIIDELNYSGMAFGLLSIAADRPSVTTTNASLITINSALSGGNVTSDGGVPVVERGICWNTSGSPKIADKCTIEGPGTGLYASILSNLTPDTVYYVRAYATNSVGTSYGNEINFTTVRTWKLTIKKEGKGGGDVTSIPAGIDCGEDCEEDYADSTSITLDVTLEPGSKFIGWQGDIDCEDGVVTMTGDVNCTAIFYRFPWELLIPSISYNGKNYNVGPGL